MRGSIMKEWRVIALLIALLIVDHGFSQKQDLTAVKASFIVGLDAVNNHGIEQSFDVVSYSEFSNKQFNLGFDGGVFFENWYFGGVGNIGFGSSYTINEDKTKASSGNAMLTTGYQVLKGRGFIVYPTIGLGIGGSMLSTDSGSELRSHYMKGGMMLNSDLFLRPGNKNGGFVLGISAGYQWNMLGSGWTGDDGSNIYFREYEPEGFQVSLKLGWGVKKK